MPDKSGSRQGWIRNWLSMPPTTPCPSIRFDRGEPRTVEEVGETLGMTREAVREAEAAALELIQLHGRS